MTNIQICFFLEYFLANLIYFKIKIQTFSIKVLHERKKLRF